MIQFNLMNPVDMLNLAMGVKRQLDELASAARAPDSALTDREILVRLVETQTAVLMLLASVQAERVEAKKAVVAVPRMPIVIPGGRG